MFGLYKLLKVIIPSLLLISVFNVSAESQPFVKKNVMEWMIQVIVPQSTVLWNVDKPESVEDWEELLQATEKIIKAADAMEKSALSQDGLDWSKHKQWQIFNSQMKTAAIQARQAVMQKNLDKLYDAGDVLYPPCEACHLQFNPAVSRNK